MPIAPAPILDFQNATGFVASQPFLVAVFRFVAFVLVAIGLVHLKLPLPSP